MSLRPLLFVAMPFGSKLDHSGRYEIDFDDVYQRVVKIAAESASVDVVRADEELYGGLIHVAMYERLLLAEIVLADLTLANPNVFYELGVRHAARPRSTILMFAKNSRLPFDLQPMRAVPYTMRDGKLSEEEVTPLIDTIAEKIEEAKSDTELTDSPLFQLLPNLQPLRLPHEVTESFRDRMVAVSDIRQRLDETKQSGGHEEAQAEMAVIEGELRPFTETPPELLLDLMLAYRAISAWDRMVRCIEEFPSPVHNVITVQEQLALALNRRNERGDRDRAIRILRRLLEDHGPSPETYGILGRAFKDIYTEKLDAQREVEASAALEEAIHCYVAGFNADPRDYYPGINAITLSLQQKGEEARERVRELTPVVSFAVTRRSGISSNDYWDVATVYELAAVAKDWPTAERAAARLSMLADEAWMLETTVNNSGLIRNWLVAGDDDLEHLNLIVKLLAQRMNEIESK